MLARDKRKSLFTPRTVFPVALFILVFVLASRQASTLDPDLWWHLQTGKDIIATKSIPHVDPYSFTKTGAEWTTHEWLSEVLMYLLYRATGLSGLVIAFSAIISLALFVMYRRTAGRPYVAALAVLLAAPASSPYFGIRPQMITFLLASIFIAVLDKFGHENKSRLLLWLPLLMLLWVNLHAGFALGLALIVLYLVSFVLDSRWTRLRPIALAGLACVIAVPINPNGFRIFLYPYQTLASPSMAALIEEWASPDFHLAIFLPLAALLFLTFGALALSPRRPSAGELLLLFITGFGALRSGRHVPIFALVAAPIFADHLWSLMKARGWDQWLPRDAAATNGKLLMNAVLLVAPLALAIISLWHFVSHEPAYIGKRNPVAAINFIEVQHLPAPIYNKYGWGGYLLFRLFPGYRVYVDGRADVYGDDFLFQMVKTYQGQPGWREPLDRYGIRTVLIEPDVPLANLLRDDNQWRKVYEDPQAVIFTR